VTAHSFSLPKANGAAGLLSGPLPVQVSDVTFRYAGSQALALENVSLSVLPRERLGILGPNGGGKSTLLKVMLGLLPAPVGSTVRLFGESPLAARRSGKVGYVPQRSEAESSFPLSVRQVITLAASWRLAPWQRPGAELRARIDSLIELVGVREVADRPIGALSGGQMQRTLIARALAPQPRLLVLDEPTVGIDAVGQAQFAELLTSVHRTLDLTVLIVSHDLRAIAAGCDRVACLSRRLHSHTSPQGLTPQVLAELFSHDVAGLIGREQLGGMHVHAHGPDECCPAPAETLRSSDDRGEGRGGAQVP